MKLGIYSLEEKKNKIGYYLFHSLIGVLIVIGIQLLYANFFIDKSLFIYGIQFLLIAFLGYIGGNFLMLRGNQNKRKYINVGLVIMLAAITSGILIGIILRLA